MNDYFDYYRVTKLIFQAFGLWPYQKFSTRMFVLTVVLLDLTSIAVPMVWYFIKEFANSREMVNCLPSLFFLYMAYLSLFTGVVTLNKVRNIFHSIEITWKNLADTDEKVIFKRYAKDGQFFATLIFGAAVAGGIVFSSIPFASKGLNSILAPNASDSLENILKVNFYNLDPKEYYLLINSYSFQVIWVIIISAIAYGIYFLQVLHHACSMFAVLSHKIENVNRINCELRNNVSDGELDKVLSSELKTCIRYHWECIRFCQLINDSTKYLWLMRLFVDAGVITVTGVQAIVNLDNPIYLISGVMNASGVTFHLFCITWSSQQVIDHSNKLHESIYDIDWYEFPPRSKKLISMMLLKSSTPCTLTAGGFMDLNLETFCRFMKLSSSYFTLVLSTQL